MKNTQLACKAIVITGLALALAACGGGGGGGGDQTPTPPPSDSTKSIGVACEGCSAQSPTQFAPTGKIGVWEFDASASQSTETVSVDIDGFNGQQVTLLLTNTSNLEIGIPESLGLLVRPAGDTAQSLQAYQAPIKAHNQTPSSISEFNTRDWKNLFQRPTPSRLRDRPFKPLTQGPSQALAAPKHGKTAEACMPSCAEPMSTETRP